MALASSTAAFSASSSGTPSAAGEALQTIADDGAGVLDLDPADLARRRPQAIEAGGQAAREQLGPGDQSADASSVTARRRCPGGPQMAVMSSTSSSSGCPTRAG